MKSGIGNIDMGAEVWKLFMLGALLSLAMIFVPPIGIFINSFTPFPLIIIYYFFGRRAGLLASGAIAVLLTVVVGKQFGLLFVVQYGLMAFLVGELARKGYEWNHIMLIGTIVPILVGVILFVLYAVTSEHSLIASLQVMVADNIRNSFKIYADMGVKFDAQLIGEQEIVVLSQTMVMIIPAILTVGFLVSIVINSIVAYYVVAKRYGATLFGRVDAALWAMPDSFIWVIIGGGVLLLLSSGVTHMVGLNTIIVVSALYFLQGISVSIFFFKKWGLHMLVKIGIYGIILSQPILLVLSILVGMADIWVDFRRIRGKLGAV